MEHARIETTVSLPELVMIAGTRGMLGLGIGLLLADRLAPEQRKAVGWTLFAVGAFITIPLALEVLGGKGGAKPKVSENQPQVAA
jgi:hypothetical protein